VNSSFVARAHAAMRATSAFAAPSVATQTYSQLDYGAQPIAVLSRARRTASAN
jgi:hypothetical protein